MASISDLLPDFAAFSSSAAPEAHSSKRQRVVSSEVVISPIDASINPHLYRIANIGWEVALSNLNAGDLCRFASTSKFAHLQAQKSIEPMFKAAPYIGNSAVAFQRAFFSLRKENLVHVNLIEKYWKARTELCLYNFQYKMPGSPPNEVELRAIATHCTSFKKLSFQQATKGAETQDEVAQVIKAASATLEQCHFTDAQPSETTLVALLFCPNLTSLRIVEQNKKEVSRNDLRCNELILQILTSSVSLNSFRQTAWELTVPVLTAIAEHQSQLSDLALGYRSLSELSSLPDKSYYDHLEGTLIATILCLSNLKVFSLNQAAYPACISDNTYVTNKTLRAIAIRCTDLKELSLFNCSKVTSTGLSLLAQRCLSLETLVLIQEEAPSRFNIQSLTQEILSDEVLNEGIDDIALMSIASSAPSLKNLTILSRKITVAGVSSLSACSALETLNLQGCKMVALGELKAFLQALPPKLWFVDLRNIAKSETPSGKFVLALHRALLMRSNGFTLETDAGKYEVVKKVKAGMLQSYVSFTPSLPPNEWD